jgi:type II pantothenate kinase
MLSVFAAKSKNIDRIIITGRGSNNPIGKKVLATITAMYAIHFEYPQDAEYTTAIGAGLFCERGF